MAEFSSCHGVFSAHCQWVFGTILSTPGDYCCDLAVYKYNIILGHPSWCQGHYSNLNPGWESVAGLTQRHKERFFYRTFWINSQAVHQLGFEFVYKTNLLSITGALRSLIWPTFFSLAPLWMSDSSAPLPFASDELSLGGAVFACGDS